MLGRDGDRRDTLQRAMRVIGEDGSGLIVCLMPGQPEQLRREVAGTPGDGETLREYGIGAQILADLGVSEMTLLTNSHRNVIGLEGYGITVVGERPIPE